MGPTATGRVRSAVGTHIGKLCMTLKVPLSKVVNVKVLRWSCSAPLVQDFSYANSQMWVCATVKVKSKLQILSYLFTVLMTEKEESVSMRALWIPPESRCLVGQIGSDSNVWVGGGTHTPRLSENHWSLASSHTHTTGQTMQERVPSQALSTYKCTNKSNSSQKHSLTYKTWDIYICDLNL